MIKAIEKEHRLLDHKQKVIDIVDYMLPDDIDRKDSITLNYVESVMIACDEYHKIMTDQEID